MGDRISMFEPGRRISLCCMLVTCCLPSTSSGRQAESNRRSPILATLYVDVRGTSRLFSRTIVDSLERAFAGRRELNFTPINQLLEPLGKQLDKLSRADAMAKKGRKLMANLEVEKGLKLLKRSAKLQERVFHLFAATDSGVKDHARLLAELAVANFLAGHAAEAQKVLHQAMVLDSGVDYDKKSYPPQMKKTFDEVKFLIDELGRGNARVLTRPRRAAVRVNGKFVGYSPILTKGMSAGRNLITLSKLGFRSQTIPVNVEGGRIVPKVSISLRPVAGNPAGLLNAALKEAKANSPGEGLASAAKFLRREILFLATTRMRENEVDVRVFAYDSRKKKIASRTDVVMSVMLDPDQKSRKVAAALVPFLVEKPRPTGQPDGGSWLGELRRSPYFWPVVGVVAGVVVIGASVSVGVFLGTRGDDNRRRNAVLLPAVNRF